MQLLKGSTSVPASYSSHHSQLPHTVHERDEAGGAGGKDAPAGTSANHHPPSQQYSAPAGQATEETASKAGAGKSFHLLHKTGKAPALTDPGGGERE